MAAKDVARGKAFERRLAALVGGKRRGNNGTGGSDVADAETPLPASYEAKAPGRLMIKQAWIDQAARQGEKEGRPWVLAIHPKGSRRILAVVELQYLLDLQGSGVRATTTTEESSDDREAPSA